MRFNVKKKKHKSQSSPDVNIWYVWKFVKNNFGILIDRGRQLLSKLRLRDSSLALVYSSAGQGKKKV